MKNQKISLGAMVLLIFALAVVPNAEAGPDDEGECTLASLNGTYGFTGTGTMVDMGPVASVGTITFDGSGNLSNEFTQSRNGEIVHLNFTGSYTVNSNCTGSAALSAGQTLDLVIVARGDELIWIRTNPGLVVTAVAKKQSRHHKDDN